MTIPEGFRLGDGWRQVPLAHVCCWSSRCQFGATYLGPGMGACAAHAVSMGALVPVAPVVEAPPLDPHRYDGGVYDEPIPFTRKAWDALGAFSERLNIDPRRFAFEATMAVIDGVASNVIEMARLRADLAAAEQRADRAEDKLRRIGEEVDGCCDCIQDYRCVKCQIADILREGGA